MKELLPHIGFIFKRNIRDKKNIYYIIMMSICSLVLLCTLMFNYMRDYSEKWYSENKLEMRQLIVNLSYDEAMKYFKDDTYDLDEKIEEISKVEHVLDVHEDRYESFALEDVSISNVNGKYISINYGDNGIIPSIILGDSFSDDDENVIICPDKLYLDRYDEISEKDLIDATTLLGSTLKGIYKYKIYDNYGNTISEEKITYEFKIVGLYDSSKSNHSYASCYIPAKQLKSILEQKVNSGDRYLSAFVVTLDNIEKQNEVADILRNMGYVVESRTYVDTNEENNINMVYYFILTVTIISLFLISLAYIKKKILNNLSATALAKSLGYNKNQTRVLYLIDNFIVVIISYILSLILFVITYLTAENFFKTYIMSLGTRFNISILPFILTFIIITLSTSIVNYYYISKRIKKTPIGILNGGSI